MGLFAGGRSPFSSEFESISLTPLEGIVGSTLNLKFPDVETMDLNQGGQPIAVNRPRAEFEFTYVFASGINEGLIGFNVGGLASAFSLANEERNYYVLVNQDNHELIGYSGYNNIILGIGNAVMTRYGLQASVGRPTTATVNLEALNFVIQPSGSGQPLPSIHKRTGGYSTGLYTLPFFNQSISNYFNARPGSIVLTFDSGSAFGTSISGNESCPLQSFGFSVELPRQDIQDFNWVYPLVRPVRYPISIEINAEAYLNNVQLDSLNNIICSDSGGNFNVAFKNSCLGQNDFHFKFNAVKLHSQEFSERVGGYNQVSLRWAVKIADINRIGPGDPNMFVFSNAQSAYNTIIFPQVNYGTGVSSRPLLISLGTFAYLSVIGGAGFLNGNSGYLPDETTHTIIRIMESGTNIYQDLAVNVS